MVTHDTTRSISGRARALAHQGMMTQQEAENLQSQAQIAGVTFVEQLLANKRFSAAQIATFASRAFGVPLLDLGAFDIDAINKDYVDGKIAATRRVLPLHRRGNRLYV